MKQITSRQNSEVKKLCALHHRDGRELSQQFIAEGLRVIQTFLEHLYPLEQLYVCTEHTTTAGLLAPQHLITQVSTDVMAKISTATTPSGLLAVFKKPTPQSLNQLSAGIVLAQISDPGNMGTLLRTTAAMGFKTAVIIEGCDPWSQKVIQASAGTLAGITIFQCSWQELITHKKSSLKLCALVIANGQNPDEIPDTNVLLVVGNEAQGLPQDWIAQCELRMTIPMPGKTESLNAAVAGSIALYLVATRK